MSVPATDPLGQQHEALKREAAESRRAFRQGPDGAFVEAMRDAMTEYHKMRGAGMSREDACKGIEAVLRDCWPKPTTKYPPSCEACDATGYRDVTCWDGQRCGRRWCIGTHPSFEHRFVVPCECPLGDRFRKREYATEDAVVAVGRGQKRKSKGWNQVGR